MSQSTSNIWCVLKREWKGYFATPVAFVFIVIFLVLIGFFTFSSNLGPVSYTHLTLPTIYSV